MDVTRMTRLAHWNLYTLAENYPEYMDSHLFKNFPQFVVIHTVKGFSVVNEA